MTAVEASDFALGLAIRGALLQVGALVVRDLAGGDADLGLQPTFFPIDAEDDERATGNGGFAVELVDLLAMKQEAANAFRWRDFVAGMLVRLDVGVVKKRFAFVDARESVADVRFTGADRFDLAAFKFNPSFVALEDVKIAQRFAIEDGFGRHVAWFGTRGSLARETREANSFPYRHQRQRSCGRRDAEATCPSAGFVSGVSSKVSLPAMISRSAISVSDERGVASTSGR